MATKSKSQKTSSRSRGITPGSPPAVITHGDKQQYRVREYDRIQTGDKGFSIGERDGVRFKTPGSGQRTYAGGGERVHLSEADARSIQESNPGAIIPTGEDGRRVLRDAPIFATGYGTVDPALAKRLGSNLQPGITRGGRHVNGEKRQHQRDSEEMHGH